MLYSRAYWVAESVIAWNVDVGKGFSCYLLASENASLTVANGQIQGLDFWQFLILVKTSGKEKFHFSYWQLVIRGQWLIELLNVDYLIIRRGFENQASRGYHWPFCKCNLPF